MKDVEFSMFIWIVHFTNVTKTYHRKYRDLQVNAIIVRKRTSVSASADGSLGEDLMAKFQTRDWGFFRSAHA